MDDKFYERDSVTRLRLAGDIFVRRTYGKSHNHMRRIQAKKEDAEEEEEYDDDDNDDHGDKEEHDVTTLSVTSS